MEVFIIGCGIFILILIILLPLEQVFPYKNLHKLIFLLNQRSYKLGKKSELQIFDHMVIIADKLSKLLRIHIKGRRAEEYKNKILIAGLSDRINVDQFFAIKFLSCFLVSIYFVLLFFISFDSMIFMVFLSSLAICYFLPDGFLSSKLRRRRLAISIELPNLLNSLAIITDAGLGLMEAVRMVCDVRKGTLVSEFKKMSDEVSLGITQKEALLHLSERCQIQEVTVFIFTLIQNLEKGASGVTDALREQAKVSWEKRKNNAKEAGQKASIKLFISMLFFVFPCLIIFLLGPAIISILKLFKF